MDIYNSSRKITAADVMEQINDFVAFLPEIRTMDKLIFNRLFHQNLDQINKMSLRIPAEIPHLMRYFCQKSADEMEKSILQKHCRFKPLGYSGDYQIIDWIYTYKVFPNGVGKVWDEFFQSQAAPEAVRNRKKFFCETFDRLLNGKEKTLSVLNIASGPCREIAEATKSRAEMPQLVHFHCVDNDRNAIAYAKNVITKYVPQISFKWETRNALRIRPEICYDLVWSAGLFDYLDNRTATALLRRMWKWTAQGGTLIFGNFHPGNPSRNYMEWGAQWFLQYRSEEDMLKLCEMAGVPSECVTIQTEPLKVNIFCVITKQ